MGWRAHRTPSGLYSQPIARLPAMQIPAQLASNGTSDQTVTEQVAAPVIHPVTHYVKTNIIKHVVPHYHFAKPYKGHHMWPGGGGGAVEPGYWTGGLNKPFS